jgi:ABC-2 type transport system permease protein
MRPFLALLRKQVHETRWTLLLSTTALFGLGWLFVWVTSLREARIRHELASESGEFGAQILRNLGITEEFSSISLLVTSWNHPLIVLLLSMWAIGRGSGAVAAEIERGTLDLLISRPISRSAYLASQVIVALSGLAVLASGLLIGAAIALRYNAFHDPPDPWKLVRPAINLACLGLPIYGYTLLASALDSVRWRPTSIGSFLTLAGFIAFFVSVIPVIQTMSWRPWLERISIFKAYNPVELVTKGESFQFNVAILSAIGAACIVLAFVAFAYRDLPANA